MTSLKDKEIWKMTFTLVLVCLLSSLCLAVTSKLLSPTIDINNDNKLTGALKEVLPGASSFYSPEWFVDAFSAYPDVESVYIGKSETGSVGFAIIYLAPGYNDNIKLLVGITADKISDVKILSHQETPGLGSRITETRFISQFSGKQLSSKKQDFDTITGATISSTAVVAGVLDTLSSLDALSSEQKLKLGLDDQ